MVLASYKGNDQNNYPSPPLRRFLRLYRFRLDSSRLKNVAHFHLNDHRNSLRTKTRLLVSSMLDQQPGLFCCQKVLERGLGAGELRGLEMTLY